MAGYMRDTSHLIKVAGFDLDSTIADTAHRQHLMPHRMPGSTWDDYAAACPDDAPVDGVVAVMRALWPTHQIHIVSGRSCSARQLTEDWLKRHAVPWDVLHLRGPGDITGNALAKAGYLNKLRDSGLEPIVFFEDWPKVAEIIRREAGVPVVLVSAGHGEYEVP